MPGCLQLAAEKPEGLLIASFPLIDDFLCRALRGEPAPWAALGDTDPSEFLGRCRHHGVAALLFLRIHEDRSWPDWPLEVRQSLEQASRAGVAQDLLSAHYLKQLIQVLAVRDIPCLLLKGEAMALSVYPDVGTRTRSDSDVFIRIRDISAARQAVLDLGYEIVSPVYKSHQFTVMRPGDRTGNVRFDIHWRISNAPRFARVLSFEEAWRDSVEVPGMTPARMLCKPHALLLACVHRSGSDRHDGDRLIWLLDIHALRVAMGPDGLSRFASMAVEKNVDKVCLSGLLKSQACFGAGISQQVLSALSSTGNGKARLDHPGESQLSLLLIDWKELSGGRDRIRLLGELILPSGGQLLHKYGKTNKLWLPLLYVWRVLGGFLVRRPFSQ